jgi:hypothetical protein
MGEERNISAEIKRQVRQRCGFGCIICGLPIYEYEHMEEWAKVKRHRTEEITLLCPNHHSEKTKGRIPVFVIKEANKNPFNKREGISKPSNLYYSGTESKIKIGVLNFELDSTRQNQFIPLVIDRLPIILINVIDNNILINLNLFNEKNEPILQIIDNELIYSNNFWDIEYVGTKLTFRNGSRKIFLEIDFEVPNKLTITRGSIFYNGINIKINNVEMNIGSSKITNSMTVRGHIAIGIGKGTDEYTPVVNLGDLPREEFQ